ncbi:hypothetical protein [Petropleomorpha daqingensis]|uniref:Uncharacterized protein n=1 Tax=Petropleomorpha daqingensis TaxID=2026353 RepID=A0A853CEA3_9ACTN|nr:hypothetical protein [Petropleomorpha daqingensis]NYJ05389.1 hypothetical protein [Petropleomorpha daqingensis]
MATGRITRSARRGLAAIVLGWLAILVGSVLLAPSASADPTAKVEIKDLTPPLVSVDAGGKVTFVNLIEDKTVQVGGGGLIPSLVTATVHTDVALGLPSGAHPLKKGESWAETFPSSCVGCTITYTYRVTVPDSSIVGTVLNSVTGQAIAAMPQNQVVNYNGQQTTVAIGVPTPFIVNTLLPLPNLPSVNLPQVPQVTVQVPALGGTTIPQASGGVPGTQTITTTTTTGTTAQSVPGTQYTYDTGAGAPQMAPVDTAAAAAFDPSRFSAPGSGTPSGSSSAAGGAGGVAGQYDGASVPVFGQLAGLNGSDLEEADAAAAAPGAASAPALPVPALAAVVALAAVTAALVRTHQAHRAAQQVHRGR